jgi:hydrogenase-4 component E
MTAGLFAQLAVLGSSGMLITGLILLWRRGVPAYIRAFRWQSCILAGLTGVVAYFGDVPELYGVGAMVLGLKGLAIPRLLSSMERRFRSEREPQPYLNAETSLLVSGLLVLFGYAISRPVTSAIALPTRAGLPLAMGLLFVGLFVIVSRKKAITQVIGFLMVENAIALLAVLGTYGIPLIVELGVFLDLLMGFLVMQIFVYDIHETFQTIDVQQLNRLRH